MFTNIIRYAITNRSQYGSTEPTRLAGVLQQTRELARNGVDFIQVREKDLSVSELLRLTQEMLKTLDDAHAETRLVVNSRVDIAAATNAHGVHLTSGPEQLTPDQARQILRSRRSVISISCHTLFDVERAREHAADLILFGPVFGKSIAGTTVVAGMSLDALAMACSAAGNIPVLALGGVTAENCAACIEAGAGGFAAIRNFQKR